LPPRGIDDRPTILVTRRRLRILTVVAHAAVTGGAERIAVRIAAGLDRDRFESILCETRESPWPSLSHQLEEDGVRVLRLDRRRTFDVRAWQQFVAFLRREQVDVVHSHLFGSNLWGASLGTIAKTPVIVAHEHGQSYHQPVRRIAYSRLIARTADVILCVSGADRDRMIELQGVSPARIRLLPTGIPDLVRGDGRKFRRAAGISDDAPVIVVVANLRQEKALQDAIAAAGQLRPTLPELRLLIAGDGPERARLEAQISAEQLEDTVTLLGTRHDVPDILAASDVAMLSSEREGMPLSILEYMAAGRPVVATAVGGVPDVVTSETGILVPPHDPRALASAAATLFAHPIKRRAMGVAARRQQRKYTMAVMIERLEELYETLWLSSERRPLLPRRVDRPARTVDPPTRYIG
jgi:glycosyltransferase involved in cell wall biosynthesis